MLAHASTGSIETWWLSHLGIDALAGMALVFPVVMVRLTHVGDVARMGAVGRPEYGGGFIAQAVPIGGAPEQVLLQGQGKVVVQA